MRRKKLYKSAKLNRNNLEPGYFYRLLWRGFGYYGEQSLKFYHQGFMLVPGTNTWDMQYPSIEAGELFYLVKALNPGTDTFLVMHKELVGEIHVPYGARFAKVENEE